MSIYSINVISNEDVAKIFNFDIIDTIFTEYPEEYPKDGEYIYVRLDDDILDELAEELDWEIEHGGSDNSISRISNSIHFVEGMRNHYGLDVEVLVHYYT